MTGPGGARMGNVSLAVPSVRTPHADPPCILRALWCSHSVSQAAAAAAVDDGDAGEEDYDAYSPAPAPARFAAAVQAAVAAAAAAGMDPAAGDRCIQPYNHPRTARGQDLCQLSCSPRAEDTESMQHDAVRDT